MEHLELCMQVLLKPIVSQLVIEPPTSIKEQTDVPSLKEVDDLLVVCIGQMAVTAGTDLLWKPLNHEVGFYPFCPFELRIAFFLIPCCTALISSNMFKK